MYRRPGASMMGMPSGKMSVNAHGKDEDHDHEKSSPGNNGGY